MKNLVILILLLLFLPGKQSKAQTIINRAFHDYNDEGYELIKANGNYYFSSHTYTYDFVDDCIITSLDSIGQIRFKKVINKSEFPVITKIRRTLDDKIALTGFGHPCDWLDSARLFIMKIDANGATIFDNTFTDPYGPGFEGLVDFIQYPDSSFYAITDSVLYHFSKNGALINHSPTGLKGQFEMNLLPNNNFLISRTEAGVTYLNIVDINASLLNQFVLNTTHTKTIIKNAGTLYTLNGSISKKDNSMNEVINSISTQPSGLVIRDFYLFNDTIYACGDNPSSNSNSVILMDTSLNLLSQINNITKNVKPISIYTDRTIHLLSNCKSQPADNGLIGYSAFPKNGAYDFRQNIGVISATLDSAYATTNYSSIAGGYILLARNYRIKLIIQNFGTTPINNFQINHFMDNWICGKVYYTKYYGGLNLLPGNTIAVVTDMISNTSGQTFLGTTLPTQISSGNLCFNTSLPNYENDFDIDNDGYCFSFNINTVGIEDYENNNPLITIFPNPANSELNFSCNTEIRKIFFLDISGRILNTITGILSNDFSTEIKNYEPGIYTLLIETKYGIVTRKFIKQ